MQWKSFGNSLRKEFTFDTYMKGIDFVLAVAKIAENIDHHPEMLVSYKKVIITTTTHSVGNKITDKDKLLTKKIDDVLEKEKFNKK